MKNLMIIIVLLICFSLSAEQKIYTIRKVAVIPIQSIGLDEITKQVTEAILLQEIDNQPSLKLIPHKMTEEALQNEPCSNAEDAVKVGKALNADLVLITSLNKLGEKILIQYILVDVRSEEVSLADNLVSMDIEDLDMVMKRLSVCVDKGLSFDETAEVGIITLAEEEEPRRRKARYYGGGTFGYLYPTNGFDGNLNESFIIDLRSGYEFENSEVGFLMGIRRGFATNVYVSRLFSKKDICPFIGGAFGFHWITHKNTILKNATSFEIAARTGIIAFRTYDFHVLVNLEYTLALNKDKDQALIFTLGLISNL